MANSGLSDSQRRQIEAMRRQSLGYGSAGKSTNTEPTEELPKDGGSFSVRLLVALLLLACFLHFHLSGMHYQGFGSEQAIEAVSRNADLQKLTDSVKINK